MRFFMLFILFAFTTNPLQLAVAQGHEGYCDKADSTTTSQKCLMEHLENAQERLNKVYNNLIANLDGDKAQGLKNIQSEWLSYRDAECTWEAEQIGDPALKRSNELSCMARVTEDRIDLLTTAYNDSGEDRAPREYGAFPRWFNVLANDYKNTFWNFNSIAKHDLNCDGQIEHIIQGSIVNRVEIDGVNAFENTAIVSIVQNPVTGRPVATNFNYSLSDEETSSTLCDFKIEIIYKALETEPEEDSDDEKICNASLELKAGNCASKFINWDGKNFIQRVEIETNNETEEEDKINE